MKRKNLTILIAEDSEEDQFLLRRAITQCVIPGVLTQIMSSGNEAVAYLLGNEPYNNRNQYPYPTFLLTDLKMPDGDGFIILEHLKNNPNSAIIPTVILSSSSDTDDVKRAYSLGASAYLIKPVDNFAFKSMIRNLMEFWMNCEVPEVNQKGVQLNTECQGKLGERFNKNT